MANTYVDSTATAGQTDFPFTFPYLKDTHVIVSIDGTETDINDTGTGEFTISTSPSTKVVLGTGATVGASVRIKRNSLGKTNAENDPLVDYTDGSVLTEKELDDAYLHNFYLSQEAVEGAAGGMSLDSTQTNWDAQNKKIVNVGDPTLTGDAANKTYVDTQVSNTVTGSTTAAQKWTFTGDGSTEFTFDPVISLGEDTAYTVAIDGVLQEPTVAYGINADTEKITFTSAPPTSSNIVVIARGYSVPVTSGAGTVTSVTAGNGLSGGTITSTGTVSIPTSGGDLNISGGKVGLGGDVGVEAVKVTGDLKVSEGADHTILTVENTNTSGTNHATAVIKGPGNATLQLYDSNTTGTNDAIYNLGSTNGKFNVGLIHDDHVTTKGLFTLHPAGSPEFPSLPTSDPSTAGYLWNDGGVVSVSGSSGFSGGGGGDKGLLSWHSRVSADQDTYLKLPMNYFGNIGRTFLLTHHGGWGQSNEEGAINVYQGNDYNTLIFKAEEGEAFVSATHTITVTDKDGTTVTTFPDQNQTAHIVSFLFVNCPATAFLSDGHLAAASNPTTFIEMSITDLGAGSIDYTLPTLASTHQHYKVVFS